MPTLHLWGCQGSELQSSCFKATPLSLDPSPQTLPQFCDVILTYTNHNQYIKIGKFAQMGGSLSPQLQPIAPRMPLYLFFSIVCLLFVFIFMMKTLDMRYILLITLQNTFASCILFAGLASLINILNTHTHTCIHIYTRMPHVFTHIQMCRISLEHSQSLTHSDTLTFAHSTMLIPSHNHIYAGTFIFLPAYLTSSPLHMQISKLQHSLVY